MTHGSHCDIAETSFLWGWLVLPVPANQIKSAFVCLSVCLSVKLNYGSHPHSDLDLGIFRKGIFRKEILQYCKIGQVTLLLMTLPLPQIHCWIRHCLVRLSSGRICKSGITAHWIGISL